MIKKLKTIRLVEGAQLKLAGVLFCAGLLLTACDNGPQADLHSAVSEPEAAPDFSGIWSDPPARAEDNFCHIGCLIEARDYLTTLLADPLHFDKSFVELKGQAMRYQVGELLPGYMTPQALEARMSRPRVDTAALCEPWGLVRTSLAPHALKITQYTDHLTLHTSEWTVLRQIHMDGREMPAELEPSKYGYSVGRYEGDELVIETAGITADNFAQGGFPHSDQLRVTERFRKVSEDRLEVEVTLNDPLTYTEPLHMARAWTWAPNERIYPYESCVVPE